jgi:16S rRNA processing protein RimM
MEEYIKIGQIINTHGHKGDLKIYPLTDDPARFFELQKVYIRLDDEHYQLYTVVRVFLHQRFVLLGLQEVPDMNAAEKLKEKYLEIPRSEVKALPAGSFYIFQLVGLAVYDGTQFIGKLTKVLPTGSNDVFVVKTAEGKEVLLPALKSVITQVDLEQGRLEVRMPPGLLD